MKNVLCIVYFFPPIGGSGIQRSLKFIKYLPSYGVNPIVSTVKEGHNFAYDTEMIKEVPSSVKIYRSNSGEKLWLRKQIEDANKVIIKTKKLIKFKNKYKGKKEEYQDTQSSKDEVKYTIKDKVFKYLEYNYYVPDSKVRWYKHAVKDIKKRILTNENIDMIFSTSYPYTDHLIALEIKKTINKPWIADFRDPWVGNELIYGRYDEKRKAKERELEKEVITYADKIINVTESITKEYISRYPEFKEKFVTITNGFDTNDKIAELPRSDKFIINYSGIVTEGRSPEMVLEAVKIIIKENAEFKKDVLINFTGYVHEKYLKLFEDEIIKDNVKINEYVPHGEILKEMKVASINLLLLLNTEESKGVYSGKIFDYILSERPILGVMPKDGVAWNLINNNNIGIAVEYDDLDIAKSYIEKIYNLWKNEKSLNTKASQICEEFSRENLTKSLVEVFNSVN
ncbi:glycosyltransferase family 4 protein [Clostridium subterminale]|uniref:Glycosyltransferase family 4 protein n=1 Tax=Clostridium subterminale TaxID=1550 RepID=A0ABN1KQ64_CLOSU